MRKCVAIRAHAVMWGHVVNTLFVIMIVEAGAPIAWCSRMMRYSVPAYLRVVAVHIESASPHEVKLVDSTLVRMRSTG
jgi:hypothetical protein